MSVVIPALNEESTIAETIKAIPLNELADLGLQLEIIVVDNGSTDSTAHKARSVGARVVAEPRRGYGAALRRGFSSASGDYIVMVDADGTYPLEDLPKFLSPLMNGDADFVTGSRLKGRILPGAMPALHRYVGVPFLTYVMNRLFGVSVSDGHCGFRAFTRRIYEAMDLRCDGMELASEMLVKASLMKARILEVPIEYRPRRGSPSKIRSIRDGWMHLRFLVTFKFRSLFASRRRLRT